MKQEDIPGLFVAVVKDDGVLFKGSYGYADVENRVPMTDTTCMELASISKAFVSEMIYKLVSEKRISLDDTISQYFPDAPAAWSRITIGHLFRHSSGIQNYLLDPRFRTAEYFQGIKDPVTDSLITKVPPDSMVKMFYSLPIEFEPGFTWSYSNTGYYLLGKIIEKTENVPFFSMAKRQLDSLLNMHQTNVNDSAASSGCLAKGYYQKDSLLYPQPHVLTGNHAFSAGAWSTTGKDMIWYLKSIHNRRLPSDLANHDWRNPPNSVHHPFTYEGGHFYSSFHGTRVISHNGGSAGFSSSWIYLVEPGISIIVLMNRRDYAAIDQLAWDILSMYEPSIMYPQELLNNATTEKYSERLQSILLAIGKNAPLPAGISAPLQTFLSSDNGRGLWQWVLERGIPSQAHCVDIEDIGAYKAYRFRLPLSQKVEYRMTMLVNQNDEVVQLWWW